MHTLMCHAYPEVIYKPFDYFLCRAFGSSKVPAYAVNKLSNSSRFSFRHGVTGNIAVVFVCSSSSSYLSLIRYGTVRYGRGVTFAFVTRDFFVLSRCRYVAGVFFHEACARISSRLFQFSGIIIPIMQY